MACFQILYVLINSVIIQPNKLPNNFIKISRSSWDHLTKIRTRVLVRPSEMVKAKNRFLKGELQSSTSVSNVGASTGIQQGAADAPVTVVTQPFVPPASVNASSMAASSTTDSEDHKDEGRAELYKSTDSEEGPTNIQQSSEFSPIQRETVSCVSSIIISYCYFDKM